MVNSSQPAVERFREAFPGVEPLHVVRAPGRVNLIGEHTDYNDGLVLPIAMSQALTVIAGPAQDGEFAVRSTAFPETVRFSARQPGPPAEPAWSNYVRGMAAVLAGQGVALRGGRLLIHSEVPIGGGVSSSAAMEIGSGLAMLALAGAKMDPVQLALLGQKAEHEYANSPCGIMDQFISSLGKADHALLLDCRTRRYDHIPFGGEDSVLLVMNTQVKHSIGGSEYPVRRRQCEEGLRTLQQAYPGIRALRDVTPAQLASQRSRLDALIYRRCQHVVTEIDRTIRAADLLRSGDLAGFGQLMYASHASLRDDYEASCAELDALVEVARTVQGVHGARMTGGGFGGCAIALLKKEAEPVLRREIERQYNGRFSKPAIVYATRASDGATVQPLH